MTAEREKMIQDFLEGLMSFGEAVLSGIVDTEGRFIEDKEPQPIAF